MTDAVSKVTNFHKVSPGTMAGAFISLVLVFLIGLAAWFTANYIKDKGSEVADKASAQIAMGSSSSSGGVTADDPLPGVV